MVFAPGGTRLASASKLPAAPATSPGLLQVGQAPTSDGTNGFYQVSPLVGRHSSIRTASITLMNHVIWIIPTL